MSMPMSTALRVVLGEADKSLTELQSKGSLTLEVVTLAQAIVQVRELQAMFDALRGESHHSTLVILDDPMVRLLKVKNGP